MPLPWFHVEVIPEQGEGVELDEAEARHATGSRRLSSEDRVVLFDGRGTVAEASLAPASSPRKKLVHAIVIAQSLAPQPQPIVHLSAALPKGDRQAVLLGMATQLGMVSFTPLTCARSVVEPGPNFADRGRRVCLEACKQCRCAYLPFVEPALTPREAAERFAARGWLVWLAHPGGRALREYTSSLDRELSKRREHVVMIGPEGGFTDEEVSAIKDFGALVCDLGPTLLRTETAAVATLAWLRLALG